jgi:hypothetical protein
MKELAILPMFINPRSPDGQRGMHQRESTRGFQMKTNFQQVHLGVFAFLTTQLSVMQTDTTAMAHILEGMLHLVSLGDNPGGVEMDDERLILEIPFEFEPLQELLDADFMQV